ncbi:MAG: AAA family ATPase [Bacteroidales bacterium]|nr:AAA family ATPase [Bacteroidales bacterium]
MENFIKYVNIQNFKSIAKLKLEDCRRINLFIGYPNVGKSNVLEALSLFSVSCLEEGDSLNRLVRFENKYELIHTEDTWTSIETDIESIEVSVCPNLSIFCDDNKYRTEYRFSPNSEFAGVYLMRKKESESHLTDFGGFNRYIFSPNIKDIRNTENFVGDNFLLPPFGENIIDVLSYNKDVIGVKEWMKQEFSKFNLEYVLDKASKSIKIQRRLGEAEVLQIPYSSIADTLQRVIFYKTAIASNKNSVLLFEEPEAHAFPPYIQTIMQDIIDAESNQFFIVTHSPLVVNAFLEYEKLRKETAIYLFDYKNDQTIAKRLSDEEMELAYEYGDDLFFNLENLL